jgi:hypothetical protein
MLKYPRIINIVIFALSLTFIPVYTLAQTVDLNANVEDLVRFSFSGAPDMITVAKCESGFKQFRADGSVVAGGSSGQYIGIFQIDKNIHATRAQGLGYDINTVGGNIDYARYLYSASGTNPWKGCLPNPGTPPPAVTPVVTPPPVSTPVNISGTITSNLDFGQTSPQIILLQQILNKTGFTVAASGAGSPGNETSTFGNLTKIALMKFQCSKEIVCSGSPSATGYGRVGPKTRAALNLAIQ